MMTLRTVSIVLVIGALAGVAMGQPPTGLSITFDPLDQAVGLGSTVDVGIRISGLGDFTAPSIAVFDLNVTFDPTILDFTGALFGDPVLGDQLDLWELGSFTAATPSSGLANIFELSLDLPGDLDDLQASDFTMATLSFDAVGIGTSSLGLFANALGDSWGDPLSANLGTGSVTVTPLPGAVLLGSLGLGSAGWVLRRKTRGNR